MATGNDTATASGDAARGARARPGSPAEFGELERLWLALALADWTSLVVVPVDPGGYTAPIATSLAEVGTRLSLDPVSALRLELDPDPVVLADVQQLLRRERQRPADAGGGEGAARATPASKTIVSIPPVTLSPLGVAVAHAADAVIVTMTVGQTRLADARRTIDLIGRDRILGCYLVP